MLMNQIKNSNFKVFTNENGPSFKQNRKVVLFCSCIVNYNKPQIGKGFDKNYFHFLHLIFFWNIIVVLVVSTAALSVLSHTGVSVAVEYPECCGMPQLERGDIKSVTEKAISISQSLQKYVDDGFDIVTPVSSCTLMFKQEYPNIFPQNAVKKKKICEQLNVLNPKKKKSKSVVETNL